MALKVGATTLWGAHRIIDREVESLCYEITMKLTWHWMSTILTWKYLKEMGIAEDSLVGKIVLPLMKEKKRMYAIGKRFFFK